MTAVLPGSILDPDFGAGAVVACAWPRFSLPERRRTAMQAAHRHYQTRRQDMQILIADLALAS